jgi:hypothetical protein
MPIRTIAFLCRGCGAMFRTLEECQQHEAKCPEVAKEKKRLHDLTQKDHEVEAVLKPNPSVIHKKKSRR